MAAMHCAGVSPINLWMAPPKRNGRQVVSNIHFRQAERNEVIRARATQNDEIAPEIKLMTPIKYQTGLIMDSWSFWKDDPVACSGEALDVAADGLAVFFFVGFGELVVGQEEGVEFLVVIACPCVAPSGEHTFDHPAVVFRFR